MHRSFFVDWLSFRYDDPLITILINSCLIICMLQIQSGICDMYLSGNVKFMKSETFKKISHLHFRLLEYQLAKWMLWTLVFYLQLIQVSLNDVWGIHFTIDWRLLGFNVCRTIWIWLKPFWSLILLERVKTGQATNAFSMNLTLVCYFVGYSALLQCTKQGGPSLNT